MKKMIILNKKIPLKLTSPKTFENSKLIKIFLKQNHSYNLLRKLEN